MKNDKSYDDDHADRSSLRRVKKKSDSRGSATVLAGV